MNKNQTELLDTIRKLSFHCRQLIQEIDFFEQQILDCSKKKTQKIIQEREIVLSNYAKFHKSAHLVPYERIAGAICSILKQAGVPLSNQVIFTKLTTEMNLYVTYCNLSSNILRRIATDSKFPVEKASRGYWQYRNANLTEKERKILYQKYVLQEKDIEIAKQMGISNQAIGQTKKRILTKLKKALV